MDTQAVMMENDATSVSIPEEPYVLVVDDDQAILSVVMLLLETEGYISLGFSDSTKVLPFPGRTSCDWSEIAHSYASRSDDACRFRL